MADWVFPIEELHTLVAARLATKSDPTVMLLGHKHLTANGIPPRVVWVPSRDRETKQTVHRSESEFRTLATERLHFELHCWGTSWAQAWALRHNQRWAIYQEIQAEGRFENGRWAHPSEAWNQKGELYILEMSFPASVFDAWVDVSALTEPETDTFFAARVTTDIYDVADTAEADGELGPTTST